LQTVSEEHAATLPVEQLSLTSAGGSPDLTGGVRPVPALPAAETATPSLVPPLNAEQATAATHTSRRAVVIGAAGTGKTRVLEARFRWLLDAGHRPEQIAVVAPSAGRVAVLRQRIEARIPGGYDELLVLEPWQLAARILRRAETSGWSQPDLGWIPSGSGEPSGPLVGALLSPGDRLALLVERIDELSLAHHDFGGRPAALLGTFVRRIDRLKAQLVSAADFAEWAATLPADDPAAAAEREFAGVYSLHERLLDAAGAPDEGRLIADAAGLIRRRPELAADLRHVLVDDAQELDLGPATLVTACGQESLTVAGDPDAALRRLRGDGAARLRSFSAVADRRFVLTRSERCPELVWRAVQAVAPHTDGDGSPDGARPAAGGAVELWRCANERSQAQAVALDIERLLARDGAGAGQIAVLVPEILHGGQAVGVALEERAIPHRLVGEAAFFQRAEIRDVLAWLRLLADPTDAPAVVRALARAPIELRSVDIARCTQIARRRKLDMVSALAAACEAPQVPPEARERIRMFLKLYRASTTALDTGRPDLYVHRLIERLGLRRQQLFAAQADVVERLRALAAFGQLAATFTARSPQGTPREFARSINAVAELGLREQEEPDLSGAAPVQVLAYGAAGGLEADHVYVLELHAGRQSGAGAGLEPVPDALLGEPIAADDEAGRRRMLAQRLYVALSRARQRLVLAYPRADEHGAPLAPAAVLEPIAAATGAAWQDREEELFGPAETLHSTYRLLRDELLAGTTRAAGRLGELRFDTDLDVTHAVVRYLELLKVAALIARPEDQSVADALRDVNGRILQAVTADQREIFESSSLDEALLDAERDARRRVQAIASRDEPSLEPFLPRRGDGVVLSASDIDTYRTCPLKYKFARVFRIPQEPTLHQRFGILVHQVLERFHGQGERPAAGRGPTPSLPELLGLLEAGWRRGGFGDSEEERQLRGKATAALTRYHERFQAEPAEPVWFERQFSFRIGPHLLRGRVDRVDRLPGGEYELIDYKTGRPKSPAELIDDVQLSLYSVGAREAWELDASRGAYYYLLDDAKVAVPDGAQRGEWVREVALEVAAGIQSQGFEPTPSYGACSLCDYRLVCPAAER
jgi:DNA helicase-2/ATP-dependent DNA helicase PcrA